MKSLTSEKQLSKIVLNGFKSIAKCELELGTLNVLIGCNGAGKSNFISFFRMIQQILEENLQVYVGKQGGPDAILHFGRRTTEQLEAELYFGNNRYEFSLTATQENRLIFVNEKLWWNAGSNSHIRDCYINFGHFESKISSLRKHDKVYDCTVPVIKNWRIYHFHDTGENSPIKQQHGLNDNVYLRPNGQNLAAYLHLLRTKHYKHYQQIIKMVQLVAPFFGDFHLRPSPHNEDMIELEWIEKGQDIPFKAYHLSDGTLRFICLATMLMQPIENQPETIFIDEPELGLHPYAILVLASLMKTVSREKQLIVSTQSVELLNEFDVEDIVVVDRKEGKSTLRRLDEKELSNWLEDYSIGELWKKNIFGGRPAR